MIKTTLTGAVLLAACAFAVAPASAASMGCSGPNLEKTETMVEAMADGPAKWASYQEVTAAQNDLLAGNMRGCAMHISRVGHMKPMAPTYMQ